MIIPHKTSGSCRTVSATITKGHMKPGLTLFLIGILGITFAGEAYNVRLVGQLPYDYTSDIWGYETPEGDEFALVGGHDGTYIIDVSTNPANPVETGFIPGAGSIWRDVKIYDHYAYVTNETGNGLDIIDLSDPWNPQLAAQYFGFWTAHNLYIDDGYAYIAGSNLGSGGIRILDLSNPVQPVEVGSWEVTYVHDLYVKNNIAYAAAIETDKVYILDVANKSNIQNLAIIWNIPHSHATWVSENEQILYVASEMADGYIRIFDITNLSNINHISDFVVQADDHQSVHNVFERDGLMYLSYYVHGTRIVDVSDPTNPVEVGYYDPYPPDTGLYEGNWGVYPFSSSGMIFASNMNGSGLSVLSYPLVAGFNHTQLGDSEDIENPIPVTVSVWAGPAFQLEVNSVTVVSGLEGSFTSSTPMTATGNPDEYSAQMPNPMDNGEFNYYFTVLTTDGDEVTEPYGAPNAAFAFHLGPDFEPPQLQHVSHGDNLGFINATGSYPVTAVASDNIGIGAMALDYAINGETEIEIPMDFVSSENESDTYSGTIIWENLPIPSDIYYRVKCWDSSSQNNMIISDVYHIGVGGYEMVDDFENGLGKWTSDGNWGVSSWGVNLSHAAHDSPNGPYLPNSDTSVINNVPFDLTPYQSAELRFYKAIFAIPNQDYGYVKISSDGENWETLSVYNGWQTWMTQEIIDISDWTGPGMDSIYLRFQLVTDGSNNADGFHVDEIELNAVVAFPVITGDLNQDGSFDILDIIMMIDVILEGSPTPFQLQVGDINGDGVLDVLDIVASIIYILAGSE